jgi:hypothetical protein
MSSSLRIYWVMKQSMYFCTIGLINEADTLESSSILINSELHAGLYTQRNGTRCCFDSMVIKRTPLNGEAKLK